MREDEFQAIVIARAAVRGWNAYHHPDSRKATMGGLPDLVLLHRATGRLILAELKTETGTLRPEQRVFLETAAKNPGTELALWRPRDLALIDRILDGAPCPPLDLPAPSRKPATQVSAKPRGARPARGGPRRK